MTTIYSQSRAEFESWAGVGAPHLPVDTVSAMQVRLMRWQRELFSFNAQTNDLVLAHGVIEEMAETAEATNLADQCDGVGDTIVYCGQLLISNRLSLAPLLYVAADSPRRPNRLSHVVGKRAQKTRGYDSDDKYRAALVEELTLCIAAVADMVIIDWTWKDLERQYLAVGEQVLQRKRGDVMIPAGAL